MLSKNVELTEAESGIMVSEKKIMVSWFLELGVGGENGEMLVKFYELSVIKISPGNLMYMVTVVNSTVQCI